MDWWKTINSLQKNLEIKFLTTGYGQCVSNISWPSTFVWMRNMDFHKQLERSVHGCYTRLLRTALNISWRDKVTNEDLYVDLLKVTRKVRERRLSAAGHSHHHQQEAVLWDPRHRSPGSRHKTYVPVLFVDTGLENISELISLMEGRNI